MSRTAESFVYFPTTTSLDSGQQLDSRNSVDTELCPSGQHGIATTHQTIAPHSRSSAPSCSKTPNCWCKQEPEHQPIGRGTHCQVPDCIGNKKRSASGTSISQGWYSGVRLRLLLSFKSRSRSLRSQVRLCLTPSSEPSTFTETF